MSKEPLTIPLEEILRAAGLVSVPQLEVVLLDRTKHPDLNIREILALRGWIKQETANFFAEEWPTLLKSQQKQPLFYYIEKARLLNQQQIDQLLAEQKQKDLPLEVLAVLKGWLKNKTLKFFQESLFSQESLSFLSQDSNSEFLTIKQNQKLETKTYKRLENALKSLELSLENLESQQHN